MHDSEPFARTPSIGEHGSSSAAPPAAGARLEARDRSAGISCVPNSRRVSHPGANAATRKSLNDFRA